MLNIDEIQNGIVIDHIKAGTAIGLMDLLGIAGNRTASVALIQNARSKKTASGRKVLTIRQNRTEMELPYDSIYCLESDLRKVNVYGDVPHQPLCSYYGKLTDLPAELFENGFLRVGRSDVVNMRYIRQISGYKVTLRNGVELSVSRNGYAAIRATYLEWKGQFSDGS